MPAAPEPGETHLLRWSQNKIAEVQVLEVQDQEVVVQVRVRGQWRGALRMPVSTFWERHVRSSGSS